MSKKSEKSVTAKTTLSGPKFKLGYGTPPCRLEIPSEVLTASGLKPNDQVELIADVGSIRIAKTGDPLPGLPNITPKNEILDNLMEFTREHNDRLLAARSRIKRDDEQDNLGEGERVPDKEQGMTLHEAFLKSLKGEDSPDDEKAQDPLITADGE
jgi:bifunctional DNA-binding transcriptional regulator/antitoxin component of YhaV-PrlF toxin-antitoxin module